MSKEGTNTLLKEVHKKDILERRNRIPMENDGGGGGGSGVASIHTGRYRSDSVSTTLTTCSTASTIGMTTTGSLFSGTTRVGAGGGSNVSQKNKHQSSDVSVAMRELAMSCHQHDVVGGRNTPNGPSPNHRRVETSKQPPTKKNSNRKKGSKNVADVTSKNGNGTDVESKNGTDVELQLDIFDIDLDTFEIELLQSVSFDDDMDGDVNDQQAHTNVELGFTWKDVLLGPGGFTNQHPGNKRFRALADDLRSNYTASSSNKQKALVAQQLITATKENGGRFLSPTANRTYTDAFDQKVSLKARQVLRDGPEKGLQKRLKMKAKKQNGEKRRAE